MMMERRYAHTGHVGEIFDAERPGIIRSDPGNGFGRAVALLSQRGDRPQARAFGATQDPVNDLALNQAAEKRNVLRAAEQVHEAAAGAEELRRGFAGGHCRAAGSRFRHRNFLTAEKLSHHGHLELERQNQAGLRLARIDHAADHRQIDSGKKESRGIVDENIAAEFHALPALRDHR
jgi:hypothetical protein